MEILVPVHNGSAGAVFTVEIDGVRTELPWVENAQLKDGVLVLSAVLTGSGQAAVTYLREFTQAAWQTTVSPESGEPGS
jgi:hypothetical protein